VDVLVQEDAQAGHTTNPLPADLATNRKKYLGDYYAERHARRRGPANRAA